MLRVLFSFFLAVSAFSEDGPSPESYMRATSSCTTCHRINKILEKYSATNETFNRMNLAIDVANVIKAFAAAKGAPTDLYNAIYYSINGSFEVINDDIDAETVVRLLDVRARFPKQFDYVLWHFPNIVQTRIVLRMKGLKDKKIVPNAQIPVVKEL